MDFGLIISYGTATLGFGLALFVFLKDRRAFLNRVFATGMVAFALESILTGLSIQTDLPESIIMLQRIRLAIEGFIPPIWLLFAISFAQTNYREAIKKMRWPLTLSFTIPLIAGVGLNRYLIREAVFDESSDWVISLGWSGQILRIVILLSIVLILMNLERILRLSRGHIRWQIKFLIIGLGGLFALRIYTGGQSLMFKAIDMNLEVVNSAGLIVAIILMARSLFRLQILSIEFYPSQAVLYGSITVILAGFYFIAVGILVNLFKSLDGGTSLAIKVFLIFLAFLGLFVLLLSDRARHRIRYFISTHLKRSTYDYRKEWMRFTQETSIITDPETLCTKVARMISDSLEVLSVTIWLFDETSGRLRPAGSTVYSKSGMGHRLSTEAGNRLMQALREREMPIDLDDKGMNGAEDIKHSLPEALPEARIRYCCRLSAGGHFLGLVTLGERVGYEPFSFEEFDLLKTITDQLAGTLLNLKLSEELRKAKEREAFQTISAFMVHDLKNLASTLSLTMQNLPTHFENTEFRQDALRVIQQSVIKVNNMCNQLSLLSKKIELKKVETDLNEVVLNCLSSFNGGEKILITQELLQIPRLLIDPEQIQKVLVNLILNAREAMVNGGEIHIKTNQRDHWVILSVRDNGCGMSKEFMENSLFKPFKTTKKTGMGIGLYQSKMIVEAHGGRIEVESEVGKGTEFRVFLPITSLPY